MQVSYLGIAHLSVTRALLRYLLPPSSAISSARWSPASRAVYQLMLHRPTVRIFAVRLALPEYRITGIVGPLNGPGGRATDLEAIEYDEELERLAGRTRISGSPI